MDAAALAAQIASLLRDLNTVAADTPPTPEQVAAIVGDLACGIITVAGTVDHLVSALNGALTRRELDHPLNGLVGASTTIGRIERLAGHARQHSTGLGTVLDDIHDHLHRLSLTDPV